MKASDLKFLIDVGVGQAVERFMKDQYDTVAVRDINPRMDDQDIICLAVSEKRIIITMDKDFGELVYHASMPHSGILLLRLENAGGAEKLRVVKEILTTYKSRIRNSFSVFQNSKLRVRKINR